MPVTLLKSRALAPIIGWRPLTVNKRLTQATRAAERHREQTTRAKRGDGFIESMPRGLGRIAVTLDSGLLREVRRLNAPYIHKRSARSRTSRKPGTNALGWLRGLERDCIGSSVGRRREGENAGVFALGARCLPIPNGAGARDCSHNNQGPIEGKLNCSLLPLVA